MESIVRDLRLSIRMLRRSPAFTAVAACFRQDLPSRRTAVAQLQREVLQIVTAFAGGDLQDDVTLILMLRAAEN